MGAQRVCAGIRKERPIQYMTMTNKFLWTVEAVTGQFLIGSSIYIEQLPLAGAGSRKPAWHWMQKQNMGKSLRKLKTHASISTPVLWMLKILKPFGYREELYWAHTFLKSTEWTRTWKSPFLIFKSCTFGYMSTFNTNMHILQDTESIIHIS